MGNLTSSPRRRPLLYRHDFHTCLLPEKCIRSNVEICNEIYAGKELPPPWLLSDAAQYTNWDQVNFQPLKILGGGKSGAIILLGTLKTTAVRAIVKIWINAFSALDNKTLGSERPFRELYTQCVLNGEPGFNCLGCFGVAPWPTQWIGRFAFNDEGKYGPIKSDIFLNELRLPDYHPTRVLFMLTNLTSGQPLLYLPINEYPQRMLRGTAVQIISTWQRAQTRLGPPWAHQDLHPDNIFVDPQRPGEAPLNLPPSLTNPPRLTLEFPTVTFIDFDLATSNRFPSPIPDSVSSIGIRERTIQWLMRWLPLDSVIQLLALYTVLNRISSVNRDFWHLLSYSVVAEAYKDGKEARSVTALRTFVTEKVAFFVNTATSLANDAGGFLLADLLEPQLREGQGEVLKKVKSKVKKYQKEILSGSSIYAEIATEGISLISELLLAIGWVKSPHLEVRQTGSSSVSKVSLKRKEKPTLSLLDEIPGGALFLATVEELESTLSQLLKSSGKPQYLDNLRPSVFASSFFVVPQTKPFQQYRITLARLFEDAVESYHQKTQHFPWFDDFALQIRHKEGGRKEEEKSLIATIDFRGESTGKVLQTISFVMPALKELVLTIGFKQLQPRLVLQTNLEVFVLASQVVELISARGVEIGSSWLDSLLEFFVQGDTGFEVENKKEELRLEILRWAKDPTATYLSAVLQEINLDFSDTPVIGLTLDVTEFVNTIGAKWLHAWLVRRFVENAVLVHSRKDDRSYLKIRVEIPQGSTHPCLELITKLFAGIPYLPAILGCNTFIQDKIVQFFKPPPSSTSNSPSSPIRFPHTELLHLLPQRLELSFLFADGTLSSNPLLPKIIERIPLAVIDESSVLLLKESTRQSSSMPPKEWKFQAPTNVEEETERLNYIRDYRASHDNQYPPNVLITPKLWRRLQSD